MKQNTIGDIGVCVIGCGRAGVNHIQNYAHGIGGAALAALADSTAETLEKAGREFAVERVYRDYRDAVQDPRVDAVVVALPTALHREVVIAAAEHGKHVLCEKPMGLDASECDDMIRACRAAGVKLQIGFMRRFDTGFLAAKERVESGEIGEVVLIKSLTRGPSVPQEWMYDVKISNGPLAEVNSHDIDTLRWFAGSEISEVYAVGGNFRCPQAREKYPDFYDNVSMICRFADGRQGILDGAVSVRYGYDARTEVLGTEGVLFIGRIEHDTVVSCSRTRGISRTFVKSWRDLFAEAYRREDQSFIDCIRENTAPRVSGLDGRMAVAVVSAGNRSIREGRPVLVDAPPKY